jgi:N-acetylglucosamine malate deacetylase 2
MTTGGVPARPRRGESLGVLPGELAGVSALAVVAHPDDESFGLGAVLAAMALKGSTVRVVCLTHGEASTLGEGEALAAVRRAELAEAATKLGLQEVVMTEFPDGGLSTVPEEVVDEVIDRQLQDATVIVTFEASGVTGHPDHRAASAAAARAATRHRILLAEWGLSAPVATRLRQELDVPFTSLDGPDVVEFLVDRHCQRAAIACHASQAVGNTILARRLDLQQDRERLRLRAPSPPGPSEHG